MNATWAKSLALLFVFALGAAPQAATRKDLSWAYPVIEKVPPVGTEERKIPGSSKSYTKAQIDDLFNPPNWFPDEYPGKPDLITTGIKPAALACGSCHLMSGHGHPESADLTGLSADYLMQQMLDFRDGTRKDPARMNAIAKGLSEGDMRRVSDWFATLKPSPWVKVQEASMVPKSFVAGGRMRLPSPEGGMEPLGKRIIMLPEDAERTESRDPHAGFIAYVPVGSIAKGKALVETGGSGKTISCEICHGSKLEGLAGIPKLAGLHPTYVARQLYGFKEGTRAGKDAILMKQAVAKLDDDDILNLAAYIASVTP